MSSHRAQPPASPTADPRDDSAQAAPVYVGRRRAAVAEPETPTAPPVIEPVAPVVPTAPQPYAGRRAAARTAPEAAPAAPYVGRRAARPAEPVPPVETAQVVEPELAAPALVVALDPTVVDPAFADTAEIGPLGALPPAAAGVTASGRRRADRHAGSRGPLFKALPSLPVLVGIAAMSITVVGVVSSADPTPAGGADQARYNAVSALGGTSVSATVDGTRSTVSRDSDRDALEDASGAELVEEADAQAEQMDAALGEFAQEAEDQAAKIELNQWQLPLAGYHLTARYGEYGLWATYHTGLDFAAPSGTALVAVANGVITSTGYDGAYGNKTVLTLEDGTEIWYCHQTTIDVSPGDVVNAGDAMGTVGATGNVTGPHLHLEVRPGGGDPVDPDAALREHGVTP